MNKDIRNYDENGNWHGKQIDYYPNGNILAITNYHHSKYLGYQGWFKSDKTIAYKEYCNMNNKIYEEDHLNNQIQIRI